MLRGNPVHRLRGATARERTNREQRREDEPDAVDHTIAGRSHFDVPEFHSYSFFHVALAAVRSDGQVINGELAILNAALQTGAVGVLALCIN